MRYLFVAMLLLACSCLFAQQNCTGTIEAQILEKHNLEPVFPAGVHIDELQQDFDADEQGKLTIPWLCAGTYTMHVHAYGYEHYVQQVVVNGKTTVSFKIAHVEHRLREVNVTQDRVRTIVQSKDNLNRDEIAAQSGKTISDMLQSVNGVTLLSNGGNIAKPVIHGMHSNRIVLLNNGIRQEDQQWGSEHAPNIDPFLASNITVVKGAAGVRYGTDAIGGVVLIDPAPLPILAGTNAELNLAGFSNNRMGAASGMLEHNFKKLPALSFRVQGTIKKGGNYRIPGYWAANTGVEEKNYSAALGWRKRHYSAELFYSHFNNDLGVYRGSHTGNEKDLRAAVASPYPLVPASFTYAIDRPMQHITHDLLKLKLMADTRLGIWNLTYGYQHNFRQEYDVVRVDRGDAQMNLTLNTQTLNLNLDHKAIGPLTGQVGLDGFYQENFFQPGDRLFIPNFRSVNGAAYAIERYKKNSWVLEGGIRYDLRAYEVFNPEGNNQQVVRYNFDYSRLSGTLGFQQHISQSWHWSATLASAWRAPQPTELFSAGLHHSAARIELGNKALVPEQSYNLNTEVSFTHNDRLEVTLSPYAQYVNNYIYLSPAAPIMTIRGFFKSFRYMQTDALLHGADLSVMYHVTPRIHSQFKGSFVKARDMDKSDWLIQMPSDRLSETLRYTADLSKTLRQSYIGLTGRAVFRQKRIPSDFDLIDFPRPPSTYALVDAELGTQLMLGHQPVHLSLSALNLLNSRYRDYMDAFRYFLDQPGRNIVLRIRVPFNFSKN